MKKYILLPFLLISTLTVGQDLKKSADEYFNKQQWMQAAETYSNYLNPNTCDSSAWYKLGYSYLQLNEYQKALDALKKAEEQKFPVSFTALSIAKAHLGAGNKEKAIASLITSAERGAAAYMRLKTDPEFEVLRNDAAFQKALELTKLNAYPCLSDENFRHFDFWIGEWEVFVNGQKVGENSITMANGGCAIHESYTTGNRNFTGQSINYYDKQDQKWHQVWVGSGGGVLDYTEIDKAEGMLQFQCDFLNPQGELSYSRLTFTANEDGTVRQFFENSSDGKNWAPGFDGIYKKKTN